MPRTTSESVSAPLPALLETRPRRPTRAARAALTEELIAELRGCDTPEEAEALRDRLIVANRGVAEAIAARYRGRGIAYDDLVQAAYEGLTKAVQRFDTGLDIDLLSYAVPLMRGEIQRYFRDHGWTVRPPRPLQELQWQISQAVDRLESELGREPSDAEVQHELDVEPVAYREAIAAFGSFHPISLDQPASATSATPLGDLLPTEDEERSRAEARLVVTHALQTLPARERRLIYLRFFEERTQQQIGDDLGMSQMQVSRSLQRLLRRLRTVVGGPDPSTA